MTGPAAAVPVPIRLPLNGFPHFYRGGARIAAFRGLPASAVPGPEDWVGSTVTRFGEPRLGLTVLPDGRTLRDAVAADPRAWLGSEHVARFGADPALLVKLLDAGQRLVVHAHPDRDFARRHLDCPHGKTEAWVVVETAGPGATVYLGFREEIPEVRLREWVRDQRTDLLLDALNEVPVRPGDALLVPAGLPHAIGPGALIVELQEPTDLSVLLEWKGFDVGPDSGHLGIGYAAALGCVDRTAWSPARLAALRGAAARRRARPGGLLRPGGDRRPRPPRRAPGADAAGPRRHRAGAVVRRPVHADRRPDGGALRAAGPRRGPAVRRQCGDGRAERGGAGPYRGGRLHRGHCGRDPAGAAAGAGRAALRKRPGWCARARWQPC